MQLHTTIMPLASRPLYATGDLEQARRHLSTLFWPHRLSLSHRGERLAFHHNRADLSALSFNALQYGSEVRIDATPTDDSYLVKFTLDGHSEVHQRGEIIRSRRGTVCVMNPNDPVHVRLSEQHNQLTLRVDGRRLHEFLEQELQQVLNTPIRFLPVASSLARSANSTGRMILNLCHDLNRQPGCYKNQQLCEYLEEMLISLMLSELPHSYSQLYADQASSAIPQGLAKVQDYVKSNFCNPISLRELATISQSSVRSLQMAFRKELGISPSVFIRNVRLDHARAQLTANSPGLSVTDAALASGFSHLGKFSHYYRLRFNELPSRTFRNSRGTET